MRQNYLWIFLIFVGMITFTYFLLFEYLISRQLKLKLLPYCYGGLKNSKKISGSLNSLSKPLKQKLVNLAPKHMKKKLEDTLSFSGVEWGIEDILFVKFLLTIFMVAFAILLTSQRGMLMLRILMIFILGSVGFFLPNLILTQKIKSRRMMIEDALPSFIEYLTIAVEAGLGLDVALYRVLRHIQGPLAKELADTMTEIKYGQSRKVAFKNLAERVNLSEFTAFITALLSAEQLGIGLSSILEIQGKQMRERQKQRIEEKAHKVPIKMLFPLVIFILPGLFIVILGPAIIQVMETLLK